MIQILDGPPECLRCPFRDHAAIAFRDEVSLSSAVPHDHGPAGGQSFGGRDTEGFGFGWQYKDSRFSEVLPQLLCAAEPAEINVVPDSELTRTLLGSFSQRTVPVPHERGIVALLSQPLDDVHGQQRTLVLGGGPNGDEAQRAVVGKGRDLRRVIDHVADQLRSPGAGKLLQLAGHQGAHAGDDPR